MSDDTERWHIDFSKEEVTEALTEYARNRGANLPAGATGISLHTLGSNFRQQGYYARLSFKPTKPVRTA